MTLKQQLFQRFPLDGSVFVAGEKLTTPYHIYDGTMLSLGGTVDGEVAARFLKAEDLEPVLDTDGRALAAIWICDFIKANLDAHHELQISLFATRCKVKPVRANEFSFYSALKDIPDLMMVCHGLWNNAERVVRYNQEHLLLNARLTKSKVDFSGDNWTFEFRDVGGQLIAEGSVTASQASRVLSVLAYLEAAPAALGSHPQPVWVRYPSRDVTQKFPHIILCRSDICSQGWVRSQGGEHLAQPDRLIAVTI